MARSNLLRCFLIVLITQLTVAKFKVDATTLILKYLKATDFEQKKQDFYFKILNISEIIQQYEFVEMEPSEGDYLIIIVKKDNSNFQLLIIDESKTDGKWCDLEKKKYDLTKYSKEKVNINYVYQTIEFERDKFDLDKSSYKYCATISELEPIHIINEVMYTEKSRVIKIFHSHSLFILIGRMMIGIADMNFKANYLLRDINIDSIGLKRIYLRYDPVIVGFDNMIKDPSHHFVKLKDIQGEINYILPETLEKLSKQTTNTDIIYPYSSGFFEDVYAFGKVILEIIENYKEFISDEDPGIVKLKEIANRMIKGEKITNPQSPDYNKIIRMNMKEVLDLYYGAMISCIKVGEFHAYNVFQPILEEAIESLKIKRFLI